MILMGEKYLPPIKIIKSKRHIKKQLGTLVILCTWLLLQVYSVFCILYSVLYVVINLLGNTDIVSDAAELRLQGLLYEHF